MAVLRRCAAALAVAALAACARAADPFSYSEPGRGVYGLVMAGSDDVRILVTRFDPAGGRTHGVAEADVRVWSGADTVLLAAAGPGADCFGEAAEGGEGCYAARLPRPANPGETWGLRVGYPDGAVATGAATVPAPPVIRSPAVGARASVANRGVARPGPLGLETLGEVEVAYTPDPLTPEFDVVLAPGTPWAAGKAGPDASCGPRYRVATAAAPFKAPTDVTVHISALNCTRGSAAVAWDSVEALVEVVAYDTAYSRYLRQVHHAIAVRRELASAGLSGAYGVFGAAARDRRWITLVAAP